ncbi:MAG TPA: hypothetical protein PLV59_03090 [Candidatus Dojkabacteria bacterium]|nr:hypothetical protein [Candidatus Dojkabacteria bacterium]
MVYESAIIALGFDEFLLDVLPELAHMGGTGETSQCCASGTKD